MFCTWLKLDKLQCGCGCGFFEYQEKLFDMINQLCFELKNKAVINSITRCLKFNSKIGGEEKSFHLSGSAADLYFPDIPIGRTHLISLNLYDTNKILTGGLGLYKTFIHIDIGPLRYWKEVY